MKRENLAGKTFGELTVVALDTIRTVRSFWWCRCSCGNEKSIAAKHLKDGSVRTCGVSIHRIGKKNKNWRGYQEMGHKQWWRIKRNALLRNKTFCLTQKQVWDKFVQQGARCALSGLELNFIGERGGGGNASLDRIDSSRGYVIDNIQWVDKCVNKMKMEFDQQTFIRMCKLIAKKYENVS